MKTGRWSGSQLLGQAGRERVRKTSTPAIFEWTEISADLHDLSALLYWLDFATQNNTVRVASRQPQAAGPTVAGLSPVARSELTGDARPTGPTTAHASSTSCSTSVQPRWPLQPKRISDALAHASARCRYKHLRMDVSYLPIAVPSFACQSEHYDILGLRCILLAKQWITRLAETTD